MPEREQLIETLRRADAELQRQRLSPAAEERLRRLLPLAGHVRRARLPWVRIVLPAAAATAALLIWLLMPRPRPTPQLPQASTVAGFGVVAGEARSERSVVRCRGACTLEAVGLRTRLELASGARVQRRGDQLLLVQGRVTCIVDSRPGKPPLVVHVSHGRIEVLGTMFDLRQSHGGGEVALRRGSIRFIGADGQTVRLEPGQRLSWPLAPRTRPAPPASRPAQAPPSPRELEQLDERVAQLRNQGRYQEAVRILRRLTVRISDRARRESFSYELGSILTYHLTDRPTACRHWRRHLRVFGASRYGREIQQARTQIGCREGR